MIAQGLASNGATVYIAGRRLDVVEASAKAFGRHESGGTLIPLELDVTNKTSITKVASKIKAEHGKLDILVNNAGSVGPMSQFIGNRQAPENASAQSLGDALFAAESFEQWSDLFNANVSTVFFVTAALLGLLAEGAKGRPGSGSSVINIGSVAAITKLNQTHFCYNASKAAVHHLTQMLATEFAMKDFNVRVNGIAPGLFPTEITLLDLKVIDEQIDNIIAGLHRVPAKRAGRPKDIASAALYLASSAGSYVNGQILVADGGFVNVNP